MREEKWNMYMQKLQGHPSQCHSNHTVESMGFIKGLIPPERYPAMLDIGCGEGLEAEVLRQLGYDVTAIIWGEINEKYARENYPGVKFVNCDMHDLPFASDSFNVVFMNQVFEHLYAPFVFLLELWCIMKIGGKVFIDVPQFKEIGDPTAHPDINLINHHHPFILCPNLYKQYMTKTGFKVYQHEDIGGGYFDNCYILEKVGIDTVHSDVQTVINERKKIYG